MKRSSSAAAITTPSRTMHAALSWNAALMPSVWIGLGMRQFLVMACANGITFDAGLSTGSPPRAAARAAVRCA
ncbi:hypothetical protein BC2230_30190 [Burkholderia cepacia]